MAWVARLGGGVGAVAWKVQLPGVMDGPGLLGVGLALCAHPLDSQFMALLALPVGRGRKEATLR